MQKLFKLKRTKRSKVAINYRLNKIIKNFKLDKIIKEKNPTKK